MSLFPGFKNILKSDTSSKKAEEETFSPVGENGEIAASALPEFAKTLDVPADILEKCTFSQLAEVHRLFVRSRAEKKTEESAEEIEELKKKLLVIDKAMVEKILSAEEIWCITNKLTGEPHMYTRIIDKQNGNYVAAAPYIYISAKQYENAETAMLPTDRFEVKCIKNENGTGIRNFLFDTFFFNGANECAVLSGDVRLPSTYFMAAPDYTKLKGGRAAAGNPDMVRWMLLLGQIDKPEGQEPDIGYKVIYNLLMRSLKEAKLLVPVVYQGGRPKVDAKGRVTVPRGMKVKMPTMTGRGDKPAVRVFTDVRKLRTYFGKEWEIMVQPMEELLQKFDCAVNVSPFKGSGIYLSRELYDKSTAKKEQ